MASKQVIDRQKLGELVLATSETHVTALTARLKSELSPHLQRGETLPDFAQVSALFLRWLADAQKTLIAADLAHERELADDAAPRRARDDAASEVRGQLISLREMVSVMYDPSAVQELGIIGDTPSDAVAVSRQATAVLSALGTVKLPKPRRKGAEVNLKEIEAELRPAAASLSKALSAVPREVREAEVTLSARNQAMAEYDRRYSATTAVLSALLLSAGEQALADKLRPLSGRRRKDADPPDDPGAPPDGPPLGS